MADPPPAHAAGKAPAPDPADAAASAFDAPQAGAAARGERSEERQSVLLALSDRLRTADVTAALSDAAELFARQLGLALAQFLIVDADGDRYDVAAGFSDGRLPAALGMSGRISAHGPGWGPQFRRGEAVFSDDHELRPTGDAMAARALGIRSGSAVPLLRGERLVAIFSTADPAPRRWTEAEKTLQHEVAERSWAVVERARAESALRDSEERFRSFADTSTDTMWIVDAATGQLKYLNAAFEAMWGQPRDRYVADIGHWAASVHPDDRAAASEGIPRLLRGERWVAEYRIVRPDGAIRHIHDTGFPIMRGGKVHSLDGIARDLTERRLAEQAQADNERWLRLLMEGIPQLVWRAGGKGLWTWASPQWTEFTGQDERASHGLGWLDAVHPDDRARARDQWAAAAERGVFQGEHRLRDAREGRYRYVQTRATPVRGADGSIVEWLGTSTDVDELRQLQQRQQLLLGELQHRVRNLLTVIQSMFARTREGERDVDELSDHFKGRLDALARTQIVATQDTEGLVDLENLIRDELLSVGVSEGAQLVLDGPEVLLPAEIAQLLGLAVHELTTNAIKYGALRGIGDARITIVWTNIVNEDVRRLVLNWVESGVAALSAVPDRRGFGSELILQALPYQLAAESSLEFRGGGVRCMIALPLPADCFRPQGGGRWR